MVVVQYALIMRIMKADMGIVFWDLCMGRLDAGNGATADVEGVWVRLPVVS